MARLKVLNSKLIQSCMLSKYLYIIMELVSLFIQLSTISKLKSFTSYYYNTSRELKQSVNEKCIH